MNGIGQTSAEFITLLPLPLHLLWGQLAVVARQLGMCIVLFLSVCVHGCVCVCSSVRLYCLWIPLRRIDCDCM